MWRCLLVPLAFGCLAAVPADAQQAGDLHVDYQMIAAGLHVADATADFGLGPWSYQVRLAYHTTGLIGFFYQGHQEVTVTGSWAENGPVPHEFLGEGVWRGQRRATVIDYHHGEPLIRTLEPPNEADREPVPANLRANTVDTLSALAELVRTVTRSGSCEATVHTFDGRTATLLSAHTVGVETLAPTGRSAFHGPALRCDFQSRVLAGFLSDASEQARQRPLHGSAWFASVVPGAGPLPVRLTVVTRWFGDATLYLTDAGYLTGASDQGVPGADPSGGSASAGGASAGSSARASAGISVNAAAVAAAPAAIAGVP
jgi:hypothetical protein